MKKIIGLILITLTPLILIAQSQEYDEVKINVILDKQPVSGALIIIEDQDTFITDFEGEAKVKIPKYRERIRLSFLGPVVHVKVLRPVDSIVVNLDSKKAKYFFENKIMKKRKIKIREH